MNALAPELRARIDAEGPITFAEYMQVALYDDARGYYGGPERTGRRGDYMTSPELDPAFGELWAHALEQIWDACGRPDPFDLVEVGPGEGGFIRALLSRAGDGLRRALRVTLVERSPIARERQRQALHDLDVAWANDVAEVVPVEAGCVFANEVLDNQPVHVLRRTGDEVEELYVATDGKALVERWLPCHETELEARVGGALPDGARVEISLEVEQLVADCLAVPKRGALVFIDYGRRPGTADTLVSYSGAGAGGPDLNEPGSWDITAHVDWPAVARVCAAAGAGTVGPVRQRDVLRALGAGAYDDRLRRAYAQALENKQGAAALRALSRRQALGALLDAGGLGGLDVFIALKGIDAPAFAKEKDRPEGRSS